jgi:hypothetical protein
VFAILIASFWFPYQFGEGIRDPIGQTTDNPPGYAWGPCERFELPSTFNKNGTVASARFTECPIVYVDSDFMYFVFVHKIGESDSRENLVLRFHSADGTDATIRVAWLDNARLKISAWNVGVITKQRTMIEGTSIVYSIDPPR